MPLDILNSENFNRRYFPGAVLERLGKEIASSLNTNYRNYAEDKKEGFVLFEKPKYISRESIEKRIMDFYKSEGFKVIYKKGQAAIYLKSKKDKKEIYTARVIGIEEAKNKLFKIAVQKSIFSRFF